MRTKRDAEAWPAEATTGDDRPTPEPAALDWSLDAVQGALQILHRKWTLRLLRALWDHDLRYHQLEHGLRIQAKVLSESLRGLERDGIVTKVFGPGIPTPVMYALTPLGRSLGSVLFAMQVWSTEHLAEVHACQRQRAEEAAAPEPRVTLR